MGVPKFARHMMTAFPQAFRSSQPKSSSPDSISVRIFFDFNSTLHESARDEMASAALADADREALERSIIDEAIRRAIVRAQQLLASALAGMAPGDGKLKRHLVFIAVDGLPPRAKMQQQRYRRYAAAWHRQQTQQDGNRKKNHSNSMWDTNAITPGTAFMRRLQEALLAAVPHMEAQVPNTKVVISGPDIPGEGEQKIFEYIRAAGSTEAICTDTGSNKHGEQRNIVYGLDADLILQALLLQSHFARMSTVRGLEIQGQDQVQKEELHSVFVVREIGDPHPTHNKIHQHHHRHHQQKHEPKQKQKHEHQEKHSTDMIHVDVRSLAQGLQSKYGCSTEDFALLCALLGNDFIPRMPCLSISEGGIELLMELRREALQIHHRPSHQFDGDNINIHNIVQQPGNRILLAPLVIIMDLLSRKEDALMIAAEARHAEACDRMRAQSRQPAPRKRRGEVDDAECMPLKEPFPDVVRCVEPGWRIRYQRHVLSVPGAPQLDALCASYLKGWVWSFRYTHQACLSNAWYFPYAAAPSATDLFNHMSFCHAREATASTIEESLVKQVSTQLPLDDSLQLLMVLPPQSSHLLDAEAARLVHDVHMGTSHMFPSTFAFHKYLKYRTWECHPNLPCVDLEALVTQLRQVRLS